MPFLRHTSTDFSQNDSRMTSFEDCPSQRNLTDKAATKRAAAGRTLYALFGPPYLAEGEMAIVNPSAFVVVGRIRLADWEAFH